ncbi:MAG: ABC transporter ATP-binding protein, partial [Clostridia bacterium]|nr:ABC transporter ATP-binding protein [Clostridia bacterium]
MAQLSLQHIDKIYDNNVQAVYDFNIDIKDGELIVLVGPSGCGKSTTLRMVAGLEDISRGNLLLDGRDITRAPAKDRDM